MNKKKACLGNRGWGKGKGNQKKVLTTSSVKGSWIRRGPQKRIKKRNSLQDSRNKLGKRKSDQTMLCVTGARGQDMGGPQSSATGNEWGAVRKKVPTGLKKRGRGKDQKTAYSTPKSR